MKILMGEKPGQIPLLHVPWIERIEIIEGDDAASEAQQPLDDVRPDKAGTSSNQDDVRSGHAGIS
jgi:hypothetical protein